jgi:hypothetical protein
VNSSNFQNLGAFLADHFGGYPDAETAAKDCGYKSFKEYLEVFVHGVGEESDLAEAEVFLKANRGRGKEPWQKMRGKYFDDCGNVLEGAKVPKALRLIIEQNN